MAVGGGPDQTDETSEMSDHWNGDLNPLADIQERKVIFAALDSFRYVRCRPFFIYRLSQKLVHSEPCGT